MRLFWTPLFAFLIGLVTVGCAHTEKHLEYGQLRSGALFGREMDYAVYTPPDFREDERLPLVVFLHGGGDSHESFDIHGLAPRLDAAITRGDVPRVVIVVPNGELGFWSNWEDGSANYQDWVLVELLPRVQRRYHTRGCPEGCHVMGVSMGGAGTLGFVLDRPELWASAGIISAPVMNSEALVSFRDDRLFSGIIPGHRIWGNMPPAMIARRDPFLRWASQDDVSMRIYLAWASGDREMIVFGSERLHQHLEEHGVAHQHDPFNGGHNWVSWGPVIERALAYNVAGREVDISGGAATPAASP